MGPKSTGGLSLVPLLSGRGSLLGSLPGKSTRQPGLEAWRVGRSFFWFCGHFGPKRVNLKEVQFFLAKHQ